MYVFQIPVKEKIKKNCAYKKNNVDTLYVDHYESNKNCLKKCVDASDATVTNVTKCVNGGTIGLPDRIKHTKEFYKFLTL